MVATKAVTCGDWSDQLYVFDLKKCSAAIVNFKFELGVADTLELLLLKYDIPILLCFGHRIEKIIQKVFNTESNHLNQTISDCRDLLLRDKSLKSFPFVEPYIWQTTYIFMQYMNDYLTARKTDSKLLGSVKTIFRYIEVLYMALNTVSSGSHLSLVRPIVQQVLEKINYDDSVEEYYNEMISCDLHITLHDEFNDWSSNNSTRTDMFHRVATFLDPRFHRLTTGDELEPIKQELLSYLVVHRRDDDPTAAGDSLAPKSNSSKFNTSLSYFFGNKASTTPNLRRNELSLEMASYMANVDEEFDVCPMEWWQSKKGALFPNLRQVYERYRCVSPVLSAAALPCSGQIDRRRRYINMIGEGMEETINRDVWLYENRFIVPEKNYDRICSNSKNEFD